MTRPDPRGPAVRAILALSAAAVTVAVWALVAGTRARVLTPGTVHERTIAPGQVHRFTLPLGAGRFAYVAAEQRGVDVVLRVLGPKGDTIMVVDSPNGRWGVEPAYFTDRPSGQYTILVSPLRPEAPPGSYRISLTREGPTATTEEERVNQLFLPWDREGYPGASVAVTLAGELVFTGGFGEAQLEYGIPITPSTPFPVASVSKQFTAFAVAILLQEGRLSLDDDIRTYLPEIPDYGEVITIGHLLHHTSGLRDWWTLLPLAGWRRDDVFTQDQILRMIVNQESLNFPPGEERAYTNTGYTLLATIVARITDTPFPVWMEERVFQPLGMTQTHFSGDHRDLVPNRAYSYQELSSGELRKAVLNNANFGATGLFTTSEDLARWMVNLDEGTVGGPEVLRLMHETLTVLDSGDTLEYAMGLDLGTYRGLRTVGHSGTDAEYRTYAVRFPDQQLSVNVLANTSNVSPSRLALAIASIYLDEEMEHAGGEEPLEPSYLRRIESGEESPGPEPLEPVDPAEVRLTDYEGRFFSPELGTYYDVLAQNGRLLALHLRHEPVILTPVGVDTFSGGIHFFLEARFDRDDQGRVAGMSVSNRGIRNLRFEKVAP